MGNEKPTSSNITTKKTESMKKISIMIDSVLRRKLLDVICDERASITHNRAPSCLWIVWHINQLDNLKLKP